MSDPLDKATSSAPPVIGEGCLSRYDPDALNSENGADFSEAARLWRQLHDDQVIADPEVPLDSDIGG